MRSCIFRIAVISFLVVVSFVSGFSQSTPTVRRPKVGLVLEGGGALGLAHIGVIEWLEEHRIPVTYVAGTSMGGLVGGIYATGHSAAEVKELVKTINWDQVLQGQTPYKDLSFRRKQDAAEYPNHLEFGLRKGVQFPEGFNSGQEVVMILDRVALPYSELKDFNDLPIPFACVATDLVASQPFVFRQGSLSPPRKHNRRDCSALAKKTCPKRPGLRTFRARIGNSREAIVPVSVLCRTLCSASSMRLVTGRATGSSLSKSTAARCR